MKNSPSALDQPCAKRKKPAVKIAVKGWRISGGENMEGPQE
jgi:hypothetical protein